MHWNALCFSASASSGGMPSKISGESKALETSVSKLMKPNDPRYQVVRADSSNFRLLCVPGITLVNLPIKSSQANPCAERLFSPYHLLDWCRSHTHTSRKKTLLTMYCKELLVLGFGATGVGATGHQSTKGRQVAIHTLHRSNLLPSLMPEQNWFVGNPSFQENQPRKQVQLWNMFLGTDRKAKLVCLNSPRCQT